MANGKSGSVERVRAALEAAGHSCELSRFPESTRTSAEAATAVGCDVAQIAKSVVFRAEDSDRLVLVIASGANRVDTARLAEALGEPIGRVDGRVVRARTGFAIGGVAPVGHLEPVATFIDRDLFDHEAVWAAAGRPDTVFKTTAADLQRMSGGQVLAVSPT